MTNGACMRRPPGSQDPDSVREERAEKAALAALIRVAKLTEVEHLEPTAVDAALRGQWRLAVRLSQKH